MILLALLLLAIFVVFCVYWMQELDALIGRMMLEDEGCSCDPRFVGVAHDLDCPVHGLVAELEVAA